MQGARAGDPIAQADGEINEGDGAGAIDLGLKIPYAQQQLGQFAEGQQKLWKNDLEKSFFTSPQEKYS